MKRTILQNQEVLQLTKYDNAPLKVEHSIPLTLRLNPKDRLNLLETEYRKVLTMLQHAKHHDDAQIHDNKAYRHMEYKITMYEKPVRDTVTGKPTGEHTDHFFIVLGNSIRNRLFSSPQDVYAVMISDITAELDRTMQRLIR